MSQRDERDESAACLARSHLLRRSRDRIRRGLRCCSFLSLPPPCEELLFLLLPKTLLLLLEIPACLLRSEAQSLCEILSCGLVGCALLRLSCPLGLLGSPGLVLCRLARGLLLSRNP